MFSPLRVTISAILPYVTGKIFEGYESGIFKKVLLKHLIVKLLSAYENKKTSVMNYYLLITNMW